MATDPTLIYIKASAIPHLLAQLPSDLPGWRDLDIQNDKLMKMILKFAEKHKNSFDNIDKGVPAEFIKAAKAARRKYGEDMRKLCEQEKKMQTCLNKVMEEHDVRKNKKTRKAFRKDMQKLNDHLEKMVYEAKQKYLKRLSGMVNEGGKALKS